MPGEVNGALLVCLLSMAAGAAPLRLAVIYGHNGGSGPRAPLKYAEADAARMAAVMTELGGVAPGDVKLLQGRPIAELTGALEWAHTRVKASPDSLLIVYLSSHTSEKEGLLPGDEQLSWKALKERVAATGARVRVTVVDGCHSSGMLETGARAAPTFTLTAEELTVKGDAFITSSAANEPSLEAGTFHGSVFTQHLLAGLRGAGDRSGDQRVSLDEAYRYAFERTQDGESGQHPGFATRLSGYGDLVLTSVGDDRSGLLVPPGLESIAVRATSGEQVIFARRPEAGRLAIPPGEWVVELTRHGATKEGQVTVARGFSGIDEGQLTASNGRSRLVRLENIPACVTVRAVREDPAILSLRDALAALGTSQCDDTREAVFTVDRSEGLLRIEGRHRGCPAVFSKRGLPKDEAALVDAARRWLAGHEPASTSPK